MIFSYFPPGRMLILLDLCHSSQIFFFCLLSAFFAFFRSCRNFSQGTNRAGNGWKVESNFFIIFFCIAIKCCQGGWEDSVTQGTVWLLGIFIYLLMFCPSELENDSFCCWVLWYSHSSELELLHTPRFIVGAKHRTWDRFHQAWKENKKPDFLGGDS